MTLLSTPSKQHSLVDKKLMVVSISSLLHDENSKILASSSSVMLEDRALLADRQGPLAHLKPKHMVISTVRVVMKQGAEILAHYLSDKLEEEQEIDALVDSGKLSEKEAEQRTTRWEDEEWNRRIDEFPQKAWTALWKFHAATCLCRLYEHFVDMWFHNDILLDKLTLDLFKGSKRAAKKEENKTELTKQVFVGCLWANAILYLADFSVHQIILTVGYFQFKQQQRKKKREEKEVADEFGLARKSANLAVSRTFGWIAASAGGAIGTLFYPGWGTLMGVNMGDSVVASVLPE